MGWRGIIVGFFLVLLTTASSAMAEGPAPIEQISIVTENTATFITAEIADTEELRNRGLMFRHILPEGHGMLFDFGIPRPAAMWMKNTYMSLDMLFIRADGTVAAIAENTEPLSQQTVSVQEPVRGVLELPAGTAKKLGIRRDDRVFHRIFKTTAQAP
jgi:uncharacterized membrane protein (UPF0127 family)